MHSSVAILFCDMQTQLTSVPLNAKGQGHLVICAKGHLVRIFWNTFSLKQLGLVALLTIILVLPYVYRRSVFTYPKQISHCSLSAHGSAQDLMVLLFDF